MLYPSTPVNYFLSFSFFTDDALHQNSVQKSRNGNDSEGSIKKNVSPMSVTVSRLCVCDSSPSSFSDSESCRDSLVLLRLPALRMDDREPPFFTRKLRAPLIWSRRVPPMRIFRMGTGEDGSGERSSTLFVTMN